jgi:hypothetical protein
MDPELSALREILKNNREELLVRKNVLATGIGYKVTGNQKTSALSIVCSVTEKVDAKEVMERDLVPETIAGIPTDVVQTGRIRALQLPTERHRPAPGGVSIGHHEITAGTLGCLVRKNGHTLILSNNHVLANSNDAQIGDPILQPGPHDGGRFPEDHIADLEEFVAINITDTPSDCSIVRGIANLLNGIARLLGSDSRLKAVSTRQVDNLVDAATARPINIEDVKDEILEIGTINGSAQGELGMAIKKSGRTTRLTTGEILQVDVTVNVQYGAGRTARFSDQLMAGAMSQGGDSGSAVLDENNRLVGLLFAGSDQSTIINRIENVFSALGITL